jgi:DNA-binding CsgD family transcriptional regulator
MNVYESPRFRVSSELLTERQLEVLLWIAEGKKFNVVAKILGMRPETVRKHLMNAGLRLDAGYTKDEIIAQAFYRGVIQVRSQVA